MWKLDMFKRRRDIHPSAQIDYDLKWLLVGGCLLLVLALCAGLYL